MQFSSRMREIIERVLRHASCDDHAMKLSFHTNPRLERAPLASNPNPNPDPQVTPRAASEAQARGVVESDTLGCLDAGWERAVVCVSYLACYPRYLVCYPISCVLYPVSCIRYLVHPRSCHRLAVRSRLYHPVGYTIYMMLMGKIQDAGCNIPLFPITA